MPAAHLDRWLHWGDPLVLGVGAFDHDKSSYLYIVSHDDMNAVKVGIGNHNSVVDRPATHKARGRRPVHVVRWAVGLGAELLDGEYQPRQHGCRYLRLDCLSSNARLCRYYEDAGFQACGHTEIHGAIVCRYQLRLS